MFGAVYKASHYVVGGGPRKGARKAAAKSSLYFYIFSGTPTFFVQQFHSINVLIVVVDCRRDTVRRNNVPGMMTMTDGFQYNADSYGDGGGVLIIAKRGRAWPYSRMAIDTR